MMYALSGWIICEDSRASTHLGLLATFTNKPGEIGTYKPSVSNVTACINYGGLENVRVNFGSWVGHFGHFARFQPGHTQGLIIALTNSQELFCLNNPFVERPRFRSGMILGSPKKILLRGFEYDVEVILLCSGITLYSGKFRFSKKDDKMSLGQL
jgi:hypothetical protein